MSSAKPSPPDDTAELLERLRLGQPGALGDLVGHFYPELRLLAAHVLNRRSRNSREVSPTTLLHEAYSRLMSAEGLQAGSRQHFLGLFCRVMDHEWVDRIRRARRLKRGGARTQQPLEDVVTINDDNARYLDVRDALLELARIDPDAAETVQLQFFCGATLREVSQLTGDSLAVVRKNLTYAKCWLRERLSRGMDRRAPREDS